MRLQSLPKHVALSVYVHALRPLSAVMSAVILVARLLRHWSAIRRSDVLVVYHQGGFGHTIVGPDVASRLFPGRKIVILYLFERTVHNPLTTRIWPGMDFIFVPIEFAWWVGGGWKRLPWYNNLRSEWLYAFMKALFPRKTVLLHSEIFEMTRAHEDAPADDPVGWYRGYLTLMQNVPGVAPRLPDDLRKAVDDKLSPRLTGKKKFCCLYLRAKGGAADSDSTSWRRTGSPLRCYWGAIRVLIARGYTVLVVGDRSLDPGTATEFAGKVFDADTVGISHDLFYLYAALESEVAVLECGGGSWLPVYRNTPHLVVNALPFRFASPGGTIYFKSIAGPDGKLLDARHLLTDLCEEYNFSGCSVIDNTEQELAEAVTDFLDHLDDRPWGVRAATLADLPAASWHRIVKSGISPVWAQRHGIHQPANRSVS